MKIAVVFRLEGADGYTYEYRPLLLRDGDKEALESLIRDRHEVSHERFMELYEEELERQGLAVVPKESDEEVEAEPAEGS